MFYQIRLLPVDKHYPAFYLAGLKRTEEPKIYDWKVLPFGTTCSPCCAIYGLQRHIQDTSESPQLVNCVEQSFYVDNCLRSTHSKEEAKDHVNGLQQLLDTFDQWLGWFNSLSWRMPWKVHQTEWTFFLTLYCLCRQSGAAGFC